MSIFAEHTFNGALPTKRLLSLYHMHIRDTRIHGFSAAIIFVAIAIIHCYHPSGFAFSPSQSYLAVIMSWIAAFFMEWIFSCTLATTCVTSSAVTLPHALTSVIKLSGLGSGSPGGRVACDSSARGSPEGTRSERTKSENVCCGDKRPSSGAGEVATCAPWDDPNLRELPPRTCREARPDPPCHASFLGDIQLARDPPDWRSRQTRVVRLTNYR